jgi:hypothetical protein
MAKLDLAFQLTANASGMAAGVAQADRELSKVGASAKATSAEFRQAAKITSELRTPTEKYADTIGKLDAMMQKGLLSQEVYGRAVAKADVELQAATSSMDEIASSAGVAERVINGLSGALGGIGDATKSVADAGISVIAFGKDIAYTYAQWRIFQAIRSPLGLVEFAANAIKGVAAAKALTLGAKALGVSMALGGGAVGTAASAVLGITNPMLGAALTALNLGRAFFTAKKLATEMAEEINKVGFSVDTLNQALGKTKAASLISLAQSLKESEAAAERSGASFASFGDVFVTPFVGATAAIKSGSSALSNGISSIVEGLASIMSPIAQSIAPVFTLIGTLVEGVLKFIGVLGEALGVVLKVAGAVVQTFLSPFIVGLANVVEAIRGGMNAAFDFIGSRIDFVSRKIQDFYAFMSKIPVLGDAFAGANEGSKSQLLHEGIGDGAVAASAEASTEPKGTLEADLKIYTARRANEQALANADKKAAQDRADADKKAAQERFGMEQQMFKAQRANDQAIADAQRKEDKEKFDFEMQLYATQRENEQKLIEANRKQAEDAAKIDEEMAAKQEDINKVVSERAAALGGKSNEALKANDLRSGEGMAQFLALASGREDPAIAEYRKQTQKLDEIRGELRALQQEKVDILGAAA